MTQSSLWWVREKAPRDVSDPTGMIYDHWEVGRVNISLREPEKCPKKDQKKGVSNFSNLALGPKIFLSFHGMKNTYWDKI